MKDQNQLLTAVELAKTQLPDAMRSRINIVLQVYQFFCAFLLSKYPQNGFNKMAAAFLTNNFFKCTSSYNYSTGNFTQANETALINELALYDKFFDDIRTSYGSENTETSNAAILAEMVTANFCSFLVPTFTGSVPVAVGNTFNMAKNTTSTVNITANDTLNGTLQSIVIISEPTHGTVDDDGFYTPDEDYTGLDSFTYAAVNENGQSNTATVTITVGSLPVAVGNTLTTDHNTATVTDITANDTLNGTLQSIVIVTQPTHGTVDEDGYYTPNTGYSGGDSFTYYITNQYGQSNTATVTITVAAAPPYQFTGATADLCTEPTQGRISWTLNMPTLPAGVTITQTNSVTLSIPTASPTTTVNALQNGSSGIITPGGTQRAEIADALNDNVIIFTISYVENSISKVCQLVAALPAFQLTDGLCVNDIPLTFDAITFE